MAAIQTLTPRTAIPTLYGLFFYTLGKLKRQPLTQALAPEFAAFRPQIDAAMSEELGLTEAQFEIDAAIELADDDLDLTVEEVRAFVLIEANQNRKAPVFRLYFGNQRPSDFKRPILGTQLDLMKPWPESMKTSVNSALQQHAPIAEARIKTAIDCTTEKTEIDRKLTEFRAVGTRAKLIEKFNALRKATHGKLGEIQHANPKLGTDWADSFFRQASGSEKITLKILDQRIAAAEAQLSALKEQRKQMADQEEAAARAQAEAERQEKLFALEAKRKAAEALAEEMAELEAELGQDPEKN